MFLGIDYGAKMAGTTSICYLENEVLHISQSKKNQDADTFLDTLLQELNPTDIFIDAPLSLPSVYFGKGNDYFFRECDKEVKAMSPMFLGGLTARAIKLKDTHPNIHFFEAYPGLNAKLNYSEINVYYKSKNNLHQFLLIFLETIPYPLENSPENWHQVDSVLAWLTGYRYLNNQAFSYGNKDEGIIWV
jgi:predicted nuclease with RNAse H fold